MNQYNIGAYVKLAKLWEMKRKEATEYHWQYYRQKYEGVADMTLHHVYIDITGKKEIYNRPEMVRLMKDCQMGKVDCIAAQTKAYLAANTEEFFFLVHFLFKLPQRIDIVTEDQEYNINTIENADAQRNALKATADKYVGIEPARYKDWIHNVITAMNNLEG